MKKNHFAFFAVLLCFSCFTTVLFAQRPIQRFQRIGQDQLIQLAPLAQPAEPAQTSPSCTRTLPPVGLPPATGGAPRGVQSVSPVQMGRSSNAYTVLGEYQNQVVANDSLNLVGFVHRQDVTVFGGGAAANGKLRYDLSTDGGASFTTDIGVLNNTYTYPARYPNMGLYNMSGTTNPLNARMAYMGPTINNGSWNGYVGGSFQVTTGTVSATETYYGSTNYTLPGSLVERVPGEFWAIAPGYNFGSSNYTDTIYVFKGTYNISTQDIDWATQHKLVITHDLTFDGSIHMIHPQIGFSPDGTTGWIGFLGDIPGGSQHLYSPIFIKSGNGGASWGTPVEVNLNAQSYVADSLQALWITGNNGVPASTGIATTTFEFDLTVDANGNPHLFTVIGSANSQDSLQVPSGPPGYVLLPGLAKFTGDVTSTNGGTSFQVDYVAPVLSFRGEFGTPDPSNGSLLVMDNFPQVSRTESGSHVFYSWVDSDTTIIGFGESNNIAPNLRIAGFQTSNGYRTCYKLITDGDFIWDGRALFPAMAPSVLTSGGGSSFELPIVMMEMLTNDQLAPCRFHYFGNDCFFTNADFVNPTSIGLAWGSNCAPPPSYITVEGRVWNDADNDGVQDPGENGLINRIVELQPGNRYSTTDQNGDYSLRAIAQGPHTLSLISQPYWYQTYPASPGTYALNFTSPTQRDTLKDFGQYAPAPITDDVVALMCGPIRAGRTAGVVLGVSNQGTVPSSGTVELVYAPLFTFSNAIPTQANHNATTRTLSWNYTNLQPGAYLSFQSFFTTPTNTQVGTSLTNTAQLTTTSAIDEDTTSNYDTCTVLVTGSYDPNDKQVTPAGAGVEGRVDPDTPLRYHIRFQNTGNDTAFYVRVEDQLASALDPATFRMLGASHDFTYDISGSGLVAWTFDPIILPDSGRDEPNSHGYITFSIQPRPGLPLGTVVRNSASIFFDFNAPVVTNSTTTTYDRPDYIFPPVPNQGLSLFPNPSSGSVMLHLTDWNGQPYDVAVMNLQGQTVQQMEDIFAERYELNRGELPPGIYLVRVSQYGNRLATAKLFWRK